MRKKDRERERGHDAEEFNLKITCRGGFWVKNVTMEGIVGTEALYYSTISSGQWSEKHGFCCDSLGLELPLCLHFYWVFRSS